MAKKYDEINPQHYKRGPVEVIDVIEGFDLNFHLGQVIKYVLRAGHKPTAQTRTDLEKAQWYLNRYIEKVLP